MADELEFLMGNFTAKFPTDRRYAANHMWLKPEAGVLRCGMSAYAIRLLREIFFLEWNVSAGTAVRERQEIGAVESSKATAGLYAPVAGTILQFNAAVQADPGLIHQDIYGSGWLLEMIGSSDGAMTPQQYLEYLNISWSKAQALLKGEAK